MADFSHPSLFDAPARGYPLEFLDETYPAKTREMELPYGENFMILTSTVFSRPCYSVVVVCRHLWRYVLWLNGAS